MFPLISLSEEIVSSSHSPASSLFSSSCSSTWGSGARCGSCSVWVFPAWRSVPGLCKASLWAQWDLASRCFSSAYSEVGDSLASWPQWMPQPHHITAEAGGWTYDPLPWEWVGSVSSGRISCSCLVFLGPFAWAQPFVVSLGSPAQRDGASQCMAGCLETMCGMLWQWMDMRYWWWSGPCVQERHYLQDLPCCWCRTCKGSRWGGEANASSRTSALWPGPPAPAQ